MSWTWMWHTVTKLFGIWYCFISPDHLSNLDRLKLKRMRMTNGRLLFIRIKGNEIIPYHNRLWFQIYGYRNIEETYVVGTKLIEMELLMNMMGMYYLCDSIIDVKWYYQLDQKHNCKEVVFYWNVILQKQICFHASLNHGFTNHIRWNRSDERRISRNDQCDDSVIL